MSTRSTILLTSEGEHWHEELSETLSSDPYRAAIVLEFRKRNVRVDCNDDDDIIITITNPDCEIYRIFNGLARMPTIINGKK